MSFLKKDKKNLEVEQTIAQLPGEALKILRQEWEEDFIGNLNLTSLFQTTEPPSNWLTYLPIANLILTFLVLIFCRK